MADRAPFGSPVVIFDVDSTIADTRQRWGVGRTPEQYGTGKVEVDWTAYANAAAGDEPTAVVSLLRMLASSHEVVLMTSRPESSREILIRWLVEWNVLPFVARVLMRPDDEPVGHDDDWKMREIAAMRRHGLRVVLAVDDRWSFCERVGSEFGIPAVCVKVYPPRDQP